MPLQNHYIYHWQTDIQTDGQTDRWTHASTQVLGIFVFRFSSSTKYHLCVKWKWVMLKKKNNFSVSVLSINHDIKQLLIHLFTYSIQFNSLICLPHLFTDFSCFNSYVDLPILIYSITWIGIINGRGKWRYNECFFFIFISDTFCLSSFDSDCDNSSVSCGICHWIWILADSSWFTHLFNHLGLYD